MNPDFLAQLRRQIGFLERSCAAYDSGHREEALCIAVSLRILFHDTKQSVSLLTHLGVKESVRVLSTFELDLKGDNKTGLISAGMPVWLDSTGERTAPLNDVMRRDLIPAAEWWTEVVISMKHKLGRKDVVLAAADQDGGAHVDAVPDPETVEMIKGIGTFASIFKGQVTRRVLDNHHFPLLRQFGHEVLSSPDISGR